jgi:hypothetical protein
MSNPLLIKPLILAVVEKFAYISTREATEHVYLAIWPFRNSSEGELLIHETMQRSVCIADK